MKIFTCTDHANFWPVGAASVVVAKDENEARKILDAALIERELSPLDYTLQELDISQAHALILWDGNY